MPSPVPLFLAQVRRRAVVLDRPQDFARYLGGLEGERVELVVRKRRTKMSNPQMRWWRGVAVPMVAEALGYDKHERDELHYWLLMECFGTKEFRGRLIANVPHSSDLPVNLASELMEWVVRWAPEHCGGLVIPLPGEVDMEHVA